MDLNTYPESREYPSRLFYLDLLYKVVKKAEAAGKTQEELLEMVREIWISPNREAVLSQLEQHLMGRDSHRFPDDMQEPVRDALVDLVHSSVGLSKGQRQSADNAVVRLVKYLDPSHQIEVISPWLESTRKFRMNAVLRTLKRVDDLNPFADYLVQQFRQDKYSEYFKLISRTPNAAAQVTSEELQPYFNAYITNFKNRLHDPNKTTKYFAMIAARTLIIGDRPIPASQMNAVPEVFSWAIEDIGDPQYEPMLTWLIIEHPSNPEVLWSAIRTANRRFMSSSLVRGLEAAKELLANEHPRIPEHAK